MWSIRVADINIVTSEALQKWKEWTPEEVGLRTTTANELWVNWQRWHWRRDMRRQIVPDMSSGYQKSSIAIGLTQPCMADGQQWCRRWLQMGCLWVWCTYVCPSCWSLSVDCGKQSNSVVELDIWSSLDWARNWAFLAGDGGRLKKNIEAYIDGRWWKLAEGGYGSAEDWSRDSKQLTVKKLR